MLLAQFVGIGSRAEDRRLLSRGYPGGRRGRKEIWFVSRGGHVREVLSDVSCAVVQLSDWQSCGPSLPFLHRGSVSLFHAMR